MNNIIAIFLSLILLLIYAPVYGGDAVDRQRESLVLLARQGQLDQAVSGMTVLFDKNPQDVNVRGDLIILLIESKSVPKALTLFEEHPEYIYPDYVNYSIIGLYRKEGKTDLALSLMDRLLHFNPTHHRYQLKKSQLLIDAGEFEDAHALLTSLRPHLESDPDFREISSYLASSDGSWIEILNSNIHLASFTGEKNEAIRRQIKALRHLTAPFVATKIEAANPGVIDGPESAAVLMTKAALYLRWGKTAAESEEEKIFFALKALSLQFQALSLLNDISIFHQDIRNIQEDMVVSLNDAGMTAEALYLWDRLTGVEPVPPYVSQSAGSAALSLQDPEKAVHILEEVIRAAPDKHHAKVTLFYAYIEDEEFHQAAELAQTMVSEVPAMRVFTDSTVQYANPTYLDGVVLSILAKLYADQLAKARESIDEIKEKAPANDWFRQISGEVALARSHPRFALEEFSTASLLNAENKDAGDIVANKIIGINI